MPAAANKVAAPGNPVRPCKALYACILLWWSRGYPTMPAAAVTAGPGAAPNMCLAAAGCPGMACPGCCWCGWW